MAEGDASTELSALIVRALDEQRARTTKHLASVRIVAVAAALALSVVMGRIVGEAGWGASEPVFATWLLLASGLALATSTIAVEWVGLGIAVVDAPMFFWSQWTSLAGSPSPGGVAGFALGVFVFLLLSAALSLSKGHLWAAAATSAACEILLQRGRTLPLGDRSRPSS